MKSSLHVISQENHDLDSESRCHRWIIYCYVSIVHLNFLCGPISLTQSVLYHTSERLQFQAMAGTAPDLPQTQMITWVMVNAQAEAEDLVKYHAS